jgi:antitoxin VapB
MALSIRNPVAEELARELARQTGKGITETIIAALQHERQRRRGRVRAPRLEEELQAISARCAALPDLDTRSAEKVLGYDRHGGLPPW